MLKTSSKAARHVVEEKKIRPPPPLIEYNDTIDGTAKKNNTFPRYLNNLRRNMSEKFTEFPGKV